ncbi:carotenoid biosynthesis protein [Lentzea sp. NPDC042327]|uniref:carotenoid biosynthesis protein n=1 Tax=Lentzea sp. NPDC042327 TaxID=3154801 RepID=UPI0033DEBA6F
MTAAGQPTGRGATGARAAAAVAWLFGALVVLAQIVYSMTDPADRLFTTVGSVLAFAVASVCDAYARFGPRAAGLLVAVAGGGGLLAETIGVHTGFPFGEYRYTGTLGLEVAGVPVVVPLAWVMMCWPALLAGRALARWLRADRPVWPVVALGAWALAAWDVFLDPQMVDAGHWEWAHPTPALPGVADVPLTNYAGWLLVAVLMMTALQRTVGEARELHRVPLGRRVVELIRTREPVPHRGVGTRSGELDRASVPHRAAEARRSGELDRASVPHRAAEARRSGELDLRSGPAPVLYLWTYGSSVWAHTAFFGRPMVSVVAGLLMGAVAVPFAVALWRAHR